MKCPKCGFQNKDKARFCARCGCMLGGKEVLSWKGHLKMLGIIFTVIAVAYLIFTLIYPWLVEFVEGI